MYEKIFREIITPISEKIAGKPVSKYLKEIEKTQYMTKKQLENYQNEKLRKLIKHAYENVPFYKEMFNKHKIKLTDIKTIKDLHKIPVITKEDLRNNFPKTIDKNQDINKLVESSSSGSTGRPFKYYSTKEENAQTWAFYQRCLQQAGYEQGKKMIHIWATAPSTLEKPTTYTKIKRILQRRMLVRGTDISDNNIEKVVKAIKNFKPILIYGYTFYIYLLAKYIKENKIDIKIKSVMTTAETLHDEWRKTIEQAFKCKVFNQYGGEATVIATECEKHNIHLQEDGAIIEVLNNGKTAKNGQRGEIAYTNLYSYAMPFIRYNIQDVVVPSSKKCTCGRSFRIVDKIEGRKGDIIKTKNGKYFASSYFIHYFEYTQGVKGFQVVQNKKNEIIVNIEPDKEFNAETKEMVKKQLGQLFGKETKLNIKVVQKIQLTKSGKRRFVISKVK